MKAAFIDAPGPPESLQYGDLPTPEPKAGEVLVRIAASSVNPIDTYIRSGMVAANLPKPFIPGCDLAGTVVALGSGTGRFKVGDRVWGSNQGLAGRQGTLAEYAAVHEQWLYATPASIADSDAAAIALVGITAHLGLFDRTNLAAGETLFVNGGTGGVGSAVVQMARAVGARVIATVGSAEKAETAKAFGADVVVNYKTDDILAVVKDATGGKGVDVVYDCVGGAYAEPAIRTMNWNGRYLVIGFAAGDIPKIPLNLLLLKSCSLVGVFWGASMQKEAAINAANMRQIVTWVAEGKLKPHVHKVFPLAETANAIRELDNRASTGKVVIKVA